MAGQPTPLTYLPPEIAGLMIRAYENHRFPLTRPAINLLFQQLGVGLKWFFTLYHGKVVKYHQTTVWENICWSLFQASKSHQIQVEGGYCSTRLLTQVLWFLLHQSFARIESWFVRWDPTGHLGMLGLGCVCWPAMVFRGKWRFRLRSPILKM